MTEDQYKLYHSLYELIKGELNWTDQKTDLWFFTENPLLGSAKPIEFFYRGRGHKVEKFVKGSLSENKPY